MRKRGRKENREKEKEEKRDIENIRSGVPKVVDIDPQGSIGTSRGSMNSKGVERGSMNNQGVSEPLLLDHLILLFEILDSNL